jgi:hypothetical protein
MNKVFVYIIVYTILKLTLSTDYELVCDTGQYVTSEVRNSLLIIYRKRLVMRLCYNLLKKVLKKR